MTRMAHDHEESTSVGGSAPTDQERDDDTVDREFRALMEGLRTTLPGVQVLFAFLLTAPLQTSFSELTTDERLAFAVAFYSSGAASVLLIAPSIHQRLRAPATGLQRQSKHHLVWATWLTIAGSVLAGIAMLATVYFVSQIVFGSATTAIATTVVAAIVIWSWFFIPLVTFRRIE